MSRQILFGYFLCLVLVSCTSNNKKHPANSEINSTEYSFIKEILRSGDSVILVADYVQFLRGDSAVKAAIKEGNADTFQTADGQTHVDVPNDYYIVNNNERLRNLRLDKNCKFNFLLDIDRVDGKIDNSLESLRKIYKDNLFILTFSNDGLVTQIKEVFLP